jgi:hypothetical protein
MRYDYIATSLDGFGRFSPDFRRALVIPSRKPGLNCGIFVKGDEISQCDGNVDLVIAGEGVEPERVVKCRDEDCDTKRIETGF